MNDAANRSLPLVCPKLRLEIVWIPLLLGGKQTFGEPPETTLMAHQRSSDPPD
jgi:hypothetical protein